MFLQTLFLTAFQLVFNCCIQIRTVCGKFVDLLIFLSKLIKQLVLLQRMFQYVKTAITGNMELIDRLNSDVEKEREEATAEAIAFVQEQSL